MSDEIAEHAPFITLMITAETPQKIALLKTISKGQVAALAEIFHNLLSIKHSDKKQIDFVSRRRVVIKSLSAVKSYKQARKLYLQKKNQIFNILNHFVWELLELVQE